MKDIQIENNSLNKISDNLAKVLVKAFDYTRLRRGTVLNAEDLFLAIINTTNCMAAKLLERLGVELISTSTRIMAKYQVEQIGFERAYQQQISFGEEARQLLSKAFLISGELGHVYVGTEHLLLAMMQDNTYDFIADLAANGLNYEFVKQSLLNFGIYQPGIFAKNNENEEPDEHQNAINYFTRDMNKLAREGKYLKVWGREEELERIIHILSRRTKNNALLIGEAGVGKTAIVEGLAQRLESGDVPPSFRNKKIVQLDISAIIAGSKIRGDVEERLLGIISEMAENPDLIIFIDEMHMIVGAGTAGSGNTMDVANIIKPYLTNGDLRVIGSTTFDEYQKYIEEDDALARRFQTIFVNEIGREDAKKVLEMLKPQFEDFHHVKITEAAVTDAVEYSDRYIPAKYLPDKAIDVIDEAAAAKKIKTDQVNIGVSDYENKLHKLSAQKEKALNNKDLVRAARLRVQELTVQEQIRSLKNRKSHSKRPVVDYEDIRKVVAKWSGVPIQTMKGDELKKLADLDKSLKASIVGQDQVLTKISAALKRGRIGLSDARHPMASFLFLGPTGVGKTQTAKEIAKDLFGGEDNLIQLDMSEYMEPHSISKLIGSPPGYVGFQEGGQLTEKVRRKPYSVVLFDEIEKAHPDLINVLLQILDEGHLQDAKGRQINFKNCVIIMTSNIGAWDAAENVALGFDLASNNKEKQEQAYDKMRETLLEVLKDSLPPEFLNRIDEVLIFRKLTEKEAVSIVKLQVTEVVARLKAKKVTVEVADSVLKFIARTGFDSAYGARNIRRKVQELLENGLADFMMRKRILGKQEQEGKGVKIKVGMQKDQLVFTL
jgi:ATP-dependent Clp protease ATP-binding subunit ClpC